MKKLKKFKKIISVTLATALLCLSAVPVMAAEEDEVAKAAQTLWNNTQNSYLIYTFSTEPNDTIKWSTDTINRITELKDTVEFKNYTSLEQVAEDQEKLDEINRTATVDKSELEFLVSVLEYDNNSLEYYDDETWNELCEILDECKTALNGDDEAIYQAYIKARNEFNKLCLYNRTMGDADNSGVVDVKDVTLVQKASVELIPLTLSQCFVINTIYNQALYMEFDLTPDIIAVTNLQKYIVGYEDIYQFSSGWITDAEDVSTLEANYENRGEALYQAKTSKFYAKLKVGYGYGTLKL